MSSHSFTTALARIKLLVLDVDGVLTDGRLYYGSDGGEVKVFNVRDGLGIKMLMSSGVDVAIITARASEIVTRRAGELGIDHCHQKRQQIANAGQIAERPESGIPACCLYG